MNSDLQLLRFKPEKASAQSKRLYWVCKVFANEAGSEHILSGYYVAKLFSYFTIG